MPAIATTRRFNVDEYYRMAEAGILAPRERLELIEGEIVRMEAIGSRHAACVMRLNRLLSGGIGAAALVAVQSPVRLDSFSEPEPDVALLRTREDDYSTRHPGPESVLLLVEVADTSLAFDREVKGRLYAAAGIPEYWLVDLAGDVIEVSRGPAETGYQSRRSFGRHEVLHPLNLPDFVVPVDGILP